MNRPQGTQCVEGAGFLKMIAKSRVSEEFAKFHSQFFDFDIMKNLYSIKINEG